MAWPYLYNPDLPSAGLGDRCHQMAKGKANRLYIQLSRSCFSYQLVWGPGHCLGPRLGVFANRVS